MSYIRAQKWMPLIRFTSASGGTFALDASSQVIDLGSGSTSLALTVQVPFVLVNWSGLVTEVVGSMTSTKAVASVSVTPVGGSITEIGTITVAGGEAVDTEIMGTMATPLQKFNAGDIITFKSKTAGSGGTTTGDLFPILYCEFFPVAP